MTRRLFEYFEKESIEMFKKERFQKRMIIKWYNIPHLIELIIYYNQKIIKYHNRGDIKFMIEKKLKEILDVEENWEFFIQEIVIFVNFDDDNNLKDTEQVISRKIMDEDLSYGNETKNVANSER